MNNTDYTRYRIAVEELGWRRADGCWQRPDQPSYGDLTQVLYHEWQQALRRAGRADHEVARLRRGINIQLLFLFVVGAALMAYGIAFH